MPYVLIVDDERPIRELLAVVFEGAGFEVAVAETGVEGLRSIAARRPDLLVTDILMPEKEGIETILELRIKDPTLPIFAMSGGSQRTGIDVLAMASRLGAIRTYAKPFDPFELLEAARQVLAADPAGADDGAGSHDR